MSINKPTTNTPYDIIYDELDHLNKVNFRNAAEKELLNAIKEPQKVDKEMVVNKDLELYDEAFRNYFYMTSVLNDPKSNEFFDEAIKEVHPTIKLKAPAKNILKFVNKVFVQELAETCFEVISKTKS